MPAISLAVILRAHIVRAVLGSGAFDWTDTRLTAAAFALFVISLAAQGLSLLMIRALYATGRTFAPFIISTFSAGLTVMLGGAFLSILSHAGTGNIMELVLRVENVPGTQVLVLVFAYSISSIIATLFLALSIELRFGNFFVQLRRAFGESLAASCAAGGAAYGTLHVIGDITLGSTLGSVLLKGGAAGVIGVVAGALVYFLLGSREFAENVQALRKRLWRNVEAVASGEQSA